tara:strand:+ start:323 stop:730 length:408 start_codon:yes stop_codon:yes gene_type:complete
MFKENLTIMKLIDDFVERFHSNTLPIAEKCFVLEEGDEIYIRRWIVNGKLKIKVKDLFLWLEKKYFNNKTNIKYHDDINTEEISQRFFIKNWRIILLLSEYQSKYRYYEKAINSIKNKSFSKMDSKEFLKLFEKK